MKINLKLINQNNRDIRLEYYDKNINSTIKLFVNKLWDEYYKLFNVDNVYEEPHDFLNKVNLYKYVHQYKLLKNIKLKYNFKNNDFIKYYNLLNKYDFLINNNNLFIIDNKLSFGHIEAVNYFIKKNKLKCKNNVFHFNKLNIVEDKILNEIDEHLNKFNINKIEKIEDVPNLNIFKTKNKYNLIIYDLSDLLKISSEYLERSNSNLIYYSFLCAINLLNKGGNLILSSSINTKFTADILLLVRDYFEDCILDDEYSTNFMTNELYNISIIFKNFKNNISNNNLNKFNELFNELIDVNKNSNSFNVIYLKDRIRFNIIKEDKENNYKSINIYPLRLLKEKTSSDKYDFIKKFNNNFIKKKNKQIINYIKLYNKYKKTKKLGKDYINKQKKESIILLNKLKLNSEIIQSIDLVINLKNPEFPYLKDMISKDKLEEIVENLKNHETRIIYFKDYILITFKNNYYFYNRYNITSYYNESKLVNFWNFNKNNIIKYTQKVYNNLDYNNVRDEMFLQFNYKHLMYYEETILNLSKIFKSKSILDIYITTPKRLVACCIKKLKYIGIGTKKQKEDYKIYIIKYGTKKQQILLSNKKIENNKFDLIFVDTESNNYKENNKEQFNELMEKLNEKGNLIYMYYSKKIENYREKNKKIIHFNKQKFICYKKEKIINKKEKIINKKTYLILSKYISKDIFKKYFPSNWKEVNNYISDNNIDFIYIDSYYRTIKKLNNIKTDYISNVDYIKHNFDDKDYLHKFVEKDNPKIFNKYFMEQYEIDKKNIDKYNKLFNKHKIWIAKPIPGGIGFGIKIFDNFNKLKEYILNFKLKWEGDKEVKKWVIQKYIDNPLLIYNKKFHIRFNFINGIVNGKKFSKLIDFYQMTVAKKKYISENYEDIDIHDTHFHGRKELGKIFKTEFKKEYGQKKLDYVLSEIKKIHKYLAKIIKFKCLPNSKNCYQIIGGDIMITKKFELKCIELNMYPGLLSKKKSSEIIVKSILKNMKIL